MTPLKQLSYVGNRGMGALEYYPATNAISMEQMQLHSITGILGAIMSGQNERLRQGMEYEDMLRVFRVGTSAGGARPKVLLARGEDGKLYGGDSIPLGIYDYLLIKLDLDESAYKPLRTEMAYHELALAAGIDMMPCEMIDEKHFATHRFDRVKGCRVHCFTATGLSGWDFKGDPVHSSYENLFELCVKLHVPLSDMSRLFRRMVFNVLMGNLDDHFKNHSFVFDKFRLTWGLSPAYDLTYAMNPRLAVSKVSRALSINGKRENITWKGMLVLAKRYMVKRPTEHLDAVLQARDMLEEKCAEYKVEEKDVTAIRQDLNELHKALQLS